jgi:hypothetical protein
MAMDVNSYKVRLSMGQDVNSHKVRLCIGNLLSPTEQSYIRMKLPKEIEGKVNRQGRTREYTGQADTQILDVYKVEVIHIFEPFNEKETDREKSFYGAEREIE